MEACLAAVQRRLLLLIAASLAIAALSFPRLENRRFLGAFQELTSFRAGFDRPAVEQALLKQAYALGQLPLKRVADAVRAKRGARLKLEDSAAAVRPLSVASLATLAQVSAHAQPSSTLTIGVPDAEGLASSLAWRLARMERGGLFVLTGVELRAAAVGQQDAELEREVAQLRNASLEARVAKEEAIQRLEIFEKRVEFQTKAHSPYLGKSVQGLREARVDLEEKTQAHEAAQQGYDQQAQRAERKRDNASSGGVPNVAIARVSLEYEGARSTLDIPVLLSLQEVAVTPLPGASFDVTRAASLWDEVKDKNVDGAIAAIEGHFNWHLHSVKLAGLELGGWLILQLLPCVLPFLLAMLLTQMRRAETSYSPFTTKVPARAPRLGFNNRLLEFVAIVILPLLALGSAASSLLVIGRLPVLPALTAAACVMLGGQAFVRLRELRERTDVIVRSHSIPPPAVFPSET